MIWYFSCSYYLSQIEQIFLSLKIFSFVSYDAHFLLFLTAEGTVKGRIWWSYRRGWWVFCHVGWGRRFTKSQPPFQIQRRNVRSYYLDLVFFSLIFCMKIIIFRSYLDLQVVFFLSHTLHEQFFFLQWFRKKSIIHYVWIYTMFTLRKEIVRGKKFCNYTPIWLNLIGWLKFTYIYWRHLNWLRTWIHRLLNSCRTWKRKWKNIFIFCNAIMWIF